MSTIFKSFSIFEKVVSKNKEGCIASIGQNVEVINCTVQKGGSPNGDALNDAFYLTDYHPLEVSIYNRYGNMLTDIIINEKDKMLPGNYCQTVLITIV